MALKIGDTVEGKYEIIGLLGEGGMGAVYEGLNTRIHRRVAIKVLHAGIAGNEEATQRFAREAQAAGRIGSEHIVEVLDMGDLPSGERYMVMEFLDGEPLSARLARGRMTPRDISKLVVDMLDGLDAAHRAGIIHRDLKPDNVFILAKADFTKIVDFGISKFNAMGGEFSMTRTGAVMGTPYYMAPEQAKGGKEVDHRVDVYATGVILYQAVVGAVPFDAGTFNELLFKIVLETPPKITDLVTGVDPTFVSIVERAMARDVKERYQSAAELKQALSSWLGGNFISAGQTVSAGTPFLGETALAHSAITGAEHGRPVPGAQMLSSKTGTLRGVEKTEAEDVAAALPVKKGSMGLVLGLGAAVLGVAALALGLAGNTDPLGDAAITPVSTQAGRDAQAEHDQERQVAQSAIDEERRKAGEARQATAAAQKERADQGAMELAAQEAATEKAKKELAAGQGTVAPTSSKAGAGVSKPNHKPAPSTQSRPSPAGPVPVVPAPSVPAPTSGGRPFRTDL